MGLKKTVEKPKLSLYNGKDWPYTVLQRGEKKMTGQIDTSRPILLIKTVDHFSQTTFLTKHTGKHTWRSLKMAMQKGKFNAAVVMHDSAADKGREYAMQYRIIHAVGRNGWLAPWVETEYPDIATLKMAQ
jgi:hypothetical protein